MGMAVTAAVVIRTGVSSSRRLTSLLLFIALGLLGAPSAALAASVSGTITDNATGAPIQGVTVSVNGLQSEDELGGSFWPQVGQVETDSAGRWEMLVPPGEYMIEAKAPGYYWQGVGSPTGNNASVELEVGEPGLTGLSTSMVQDTSPFVGVFPTVMRWSHEPKASFASMVIYLEYGGFAAVPKGWTGEHVISQILDARGRPLWPKGITIDEPVLDGGEGEGAAQFSMGSAEGCNFFSSYEGHRPDVRHLRIRSYLKSDPSVKAEEVIAPDFSACKATRLAVNRPIRLDRHTRLELTAHLVDRLPGKEKVPGTMKFVVDGRRPVSIHTGDATSYVTRTVPDDTHRGWNRVKVYFEPSLPITTAPPPQTLRFKVHRPGRRR